ncbi:LysR family transcriptional regulator ArgP [Paraglaciecola aquimarina]|uniref:LysR family transcriptional regulator ArgP n=1 Tax=Paraglaciecola aquimarina TaxID=1235557 RepID=A0ABU3SXJ8_9ALTE|nr:LysR family transcriptional regulator ArgP [Paraglaciecola aquimarina]MDU0354725.1 LysR family transcriptional regulator ArgP [Paraglaciecola aquimarina]
MMDYKLLHALSVLINQQSFEKAANKLCITQSAISQRIKLLEQTIGQPVVIRKQPITATRIGKKLLAHYQQVCLLEQDVLPEINAQHISEKVAINLATNADSLATWLVDAISDVTHLHKIALNLHIADENQTINYLKNGEVFGAISCQDKALPGCTLDKLGDMHYSLVASPEFKQRYFDTGITVKQLKQAPAAAYDQHDDMHIEFIASTFGLPGGSFPCHTVRSSEAFVNFAKKGLAYCLIPKLQIQQELSSGQLIDLMPNQSVTRTLYWHRWVLLKGAFKYLSDAIIDRAQIAIKSQ